jgi:regulator of sigma E protease
LNTIETVFYFLLALLLLVLVHEYGHFLVARLCGVKVVRFSFGFGKVLARWQSKRGTEFVWSLFPLGGYVKMLDEDEAPVPDAEKHLAFNNKSVWARMAIALAGPLFNFLFAFCAFWLVLVVGIRSLAPIVDDVEPGSIAATAGLLPKQEVVVLNDKKIASWRDFQYALMPLLGSSETVPIIVKSIADGQRSTLFLSLKKWQLDARKPDVLNSLGIKPFVPQLPPVVGEVLDDSPAKQAGFNVGDVIFSANSVLMTDWIDLLHWVADKPGQTVSMVVTRHGKHETLSVKLGLIRQNGRDIGLLGVKSKPVDWPAGWLRLQREGPIDAVSLALKQTVELTSATFSLLGRLATGKVSLRGISGPVGIAEGAFESARSGFAYYASFLALVSISLGVLNLLPIPLLDGGHLLYYFIEVIRRRPLSGSTKSVGTAFGFMFLMALMTLALTNDLGRLVNNH